jgi:hypothetical protein
VRTFVRDIQAEYQKVRGVVNLCLPLMTRDEDKRRMNSLADHLARQMEECDSVEAYRVMIFRTLCLRCIGLLILLGLVAGTWWLFF